MHVYIHTHTNTDIHNSTFISTSAIEPMTCSAPSFLLGSLWSGGSESVCTQNTITGSRIFFRFAHALVRNCWAATSGDTRSSKMSGGRRGQRGEEGGGGRRRQEGGRGEEEEGGGG